MVQLNTGDISMKALHFLWSRFSSSYELRSLTFLFVLIFHILMVWRGYPYGADENIIYTIMMFVLGYGFGLYYDLLFGPGYAFKRLPGQGLMNVDGRGLVLLLMLHPVTLFCLIIFTHIVGDALTVGGTTNWVLAVCALLLGPSGALLSNYFTGVMLVGDLRE